MRIDSQARPEGSRVITEVPHRAEAKELESLAVYRTKHGFKAHPKDKGLSVSRLCGRRR